MDREEAKKISEEIEASGLSTEKENNLSEEELESLNDADYVAEYAEQYPDEDERDFEDVEDEDEDFDEEDEDDSEEPTRIEQITIVQQPVTIKTDVGAEVGAKGEIKPFVKISLERHLAIPGDDNTIVWDAIAGDFGELAALVEAYITQMKEDLNTTERSRGNAN